MTVTSAPAGTLDAAASVVVNGPRDFPEDWDQVNWARAEDEVRRLRQRIFTASRAGAHRTVRSLQRLMLRSRANALLSTRRVAQVNQGRRTAGIDGRTALSGPDRVELARWVQQHGHRSAARAVRRIYIPKGNGKRRPLGIPVIGDRASQAVVLNALEPEWEARFEPRSYGFRPGRGCHDAIEAIFAVAKGANPRRAWVVDADLTAAFDRIDHDLLLSQLHGFPAKARVGRWLAAGVIENGQYAPTDEGTPQGGVISPLLMNIALHGMETAAGARSSTAPSHRGWSVPGTPVLVRYADDLVVLCYSREQAEQVKQRLAAWLAPRGLTFNEDKTRIVHLSEGFDFLGFNVRHYRSTGKLADQAVQSGRQAVSGSAAHRGARPLRRECAGRDQQAQPDPARLGRVLPDGRVQAGVRPDRPHPRVDDAHLGQTPARDEVVPMDREPLLRAVSPDQARPMALR
jgi:RNA-directed DNA polymerase